MDKYITSAGLFFNLIGVFLIFFGARPFRDLPIGPQSSGRDTGYLYIIYPRFLLPLGLGFLACGTILQLIGIWIN